MAAAVFLRSLARKMARAHRRAGSMAAPAQGLVLLPWRSRQPDTMYYLQSRGHLNLSLIFLLDLLFFFIQQGRVDVEQFGVGTAGAAGLRRLATKLARAPPRPHHRLVHECGLHSLNSPNSGASGSASTPPTSKIVCLCWLDCESSFIQFYFSSPSVTSRYIIFPPYRNYRKCVKW
jgi:hypothetical protein